MTRVVGTHTAEAAAADNDVNMSGDTAGHSLVPAQGGLSQHHDIEPLSGPAPGFGGRFQDGNTDAPSRRGGSPLVGANSCNPSPWRST